MHPDDLHRPQAFDSFLSEAAATDALDLTDAAIAAHRDEETPAGPVTDPAQLDELFG